MLIRHDPHLSRGRILMPVPLAEWRTPSISLPKDQFGNDGVRTRFRLRVRLNDGHIAWTGWFEDRDDADAFLFALASGSLRYERELWRLPTPEWHPGIGEDLSYEFATQTFLTTTGSNQTYTKPSDWNDSNNTIESIGGGASGGVANRSTATRSFGSGGGGGGYGIYTNLTLSGNATYRIGSGGTAVNRTTAGTTAGNAGSDSWFGVSATDYASASTGATAGSAGAAVNSGNVSGGAGGSGKGTGNFAGGAGGGVTYGSGTNPRAGAGGGGAGGLNGAGNAGATVTTSGTSGQSAGGSGDAGSGGPAGTAGGGTGGNGTEWSASYGSGGGGGGATFTTTGTSGSGGNYGGGGGGMGCGSTTVAGDGTSGAGIQGLIVITYTPLGGALIWNPAQSLQHILVR